ncbi:hypothetical protein A8H39_01580 [Paraburkholderia fungorum]|uniref:hypothetical protein n=1 Tax=Paraburkholderia fungorum TaxID=134537 RepID=UPI0004870D95|nr:hypothetical protein [Paraburkholderia fungorum]MBB5546664.1 hypothetical protein [Paraburkholderia fungorum]PNE59863.1 hypothetical protein A8H39_01580 [Paraburkholderia fungorum]
MTQETFLAAVTALAERLQALVPRVKALGLPCALATMAVPGGQILSLHVAHTIEDLATTVVAGRLGAHFSRQAPDQFGQSVNRMTLLADADSDTTASSLPVEQIDTILASAVPQLPAPAIYIYRGVNQLLTKRHTLSRHFASGDLAAFSAHVAVMMGLTLEKSDPIHFSAMRDEVERQLAG